MEKLIRELGKFRNTENENLFAALHKTVEAIQHCPVQVRTEMGVDPEDDRVTEQITALYATMPEEKVASFLVRIQEGTARKRQKTDQH